MKGTPYIGERWGDYKSPTVAMHEMEIQKMLERNKHKMIDKHPDIVKHNDSGVSDFPAGEAEHV